MLHHRTTEQTSGDRSPESAARAPAADPYRWLERDSPATRTWVARQAARAAPLLSGLPTRDALEQRLRAFWLCQERCTADVGLPETDCAAPVDGVKASVLAWTPDWQGFYYDRFWPWPGCHALYYHAAGTPQTQDQLVYQRPDHPTWHYAPAVTADARYLVISVLHGSELRNLLLVLDLACPDAPILPLSETFAGRYDLIANNGPLFWLRSEEAAAPNGRVVAVDLRQPSRADWQEVIAPTSWPLHGVQQLHDQFGALYLKHACSQVVLYDRTGQRLAAIALPGCGTVLALDAVPVEKIVYTYTDFLTPPTSYVYDPATGVSTALNSCGNSGEACCPWHCRDYETQQVSVPSRDGAPISMFLSCRRGLRLDGGNPTCLYVYGGFNTALTPVFSAEAAAWMEMGGVWAVANLRGGGEYGPQWHAAAIRRNKQVTFDDCIAAAEWLITSQITSPTRLALRGESNGGLTAAACLIQRPDLFAAVIIEAGVLDLLRFDRLGSGQDWLCEYGSPHKPLDAQALQACSPLYNVRPGTSYPATLIMTAAKDERVGAAHSFKFAAALQEAQAGPAPILLRVAAGAGHGAGGSTELQIAAAADRLAFLAYALHCP